MKKIRKLAVLLLCTAIVFGSLPMTSAVADSGTECTTHTYGAWVTTVQPTCSTIGERTKECTVCGHKETQTVATGDHTYGGWQYIKSVTCTENGIRSKECSVCGYVTTQEFPLAAGHSYKQTYVAPTDTEDGYTLHTCTACGDEYKDDFIPVDSVCETHTYGSWVVTVEPTCSMIGERMKACTVCGYKATQTVAVVEHTYGGWQYIKSVTCTENGVRAKECSVCGYFTTQEFPLATGHSYTTSTVDVTCTTYGYVLHTCTKCGDTYETDFVLAPGHSYGDWQVVVEANCTTDGQITRTCATCEETETQIVDAWGHAYSEWNVLTPATCYDAGEHSKTCATCGDVVSEIIPALGHNYIETTTAPSCEEKGFNHFECSNCGDSFDGRYVDALGHSYSEWQVVVEANCTTDGQITRTCATCEETETQIVDAWGHDYIITTIEASCESYGCFRYDCSNCTDSYESNFVPALGHSYGDWQVVSAPSCSEAGEQTRVCATCGNTESQSIDALGHAYGEWNVLTPATCYDAGEHSKTCATCGDVVSEIIPALGHNYIETTTAPSCEEKGFNHFECSNCGDSFDGRYVDALGHNYSETVVEPSDTEKGYTLYTCTVCGNEYKDNFVSASGEHRILISSAITGRGKTVKLAVSLEDNPGISAFVLGFDYNKTALTLESVEISEELGGNAIISEKAVWYSDADVDYNGEIMVLTFTVAEDAEFGDYGIEITYNAGDISNREEEMINFVVVSGMVSIIDYTAGDINDDGLVDSRDLTRISKYLAEIEGITANPVALDVSNDGVVNNKDLVLLMRYLAGEAVEIY